MSREEPCFGVEVLAFSSVGGESYITMEGRGSVFCFDLH